MKRQFVFLAAVLILSGCTSFVLRTVVGTVDPYFHGEGIDGTQFEKVSEKVYTFRWNWYRNIIIRSDDGLVIIDPVNKKMAKALKKELDKHFPGEKVNTLIYSRYHLDHTSGGGELNPSHVIAHEKSRFYWDNIEHIRRFWSRRDTSVETRN